MRKKGQVTLFIILGIVIIAVIAVALMYRESLGESIARIEILKSENIRQEESQVKNHAEACLLKVSVEGLKKTLAEGGYYNNAPHSLPVFTNDIPYYLYVEEENLPTLKDIENNLEKYIEDNIDACLKTYPKKLEFGVASADVSLSDEVEVEVKQSLVVDVGDGKAMVRKFGVVLDAEVESIYDSVMEFYGEAKDFNGSDFGSKAEMAFENEYEISISHPNDDDHVYGLHFEKAIEEEKALDYYFAIRYPKVESIGIPEMPESLQGAESEEEEEKPTYIESEAGIDKEAFEIKEGEPLPEAIANQEGGEAVAAAEEEDKNFFKMMSDEDYEVPGGEDEG